MHLVRGSLVCLFLLAALSLVFAAQEPSPAVCRGRSLPITLLPWPEVTGPELPLRFGGTRPFPKMQFRSDNARRIVVKSSDEFSNFWKEFTSQVPPGSWTPPIPEIDFSKETVIVAAMGQKPSSSYWTIIDGACEIDGQVEVFVSNVESASCTGHFPVVTYPADAVRIPRTDLPIVFRETQMPCTQWRKHLKLSK